MQMGVLRRGGMFPFDRGRKAAVVPSFKPRSGPVPYDVQYTDTNGDTWYDYAKVNSNADGYYETVFQDSNFDGGHDIWLSDQNLDGYYGVAYLDTKGDGYRETCLVDSDGATSFDIPTADFDLNGTFTSGSWDSPVMSDPFSPQLTSLTATAVLMN